MEGGDRRHVVRRQLEVEDGEVLRYPGCVRRLREDDVAALDMPSQGHLSGCAVQAAGDANDSRIVEHLALGDRRPRLGGDPVPAIERAKVVLGEVRVEFDLVDRRSNRGLLQQPLDVVRLEVGDSDRPGASGAVDLLERLPRLDEVANARQRPVDQEEIQVVELHRGERSVELLQRRVVGVEAVVELARDEDLAAVESRISNLLPYFPLVAVHLGRVDMTVADPQRLQRRRPRLRRRNLEDTEPQLRDFDAVVEPKVWDCSH